MKNIFIMILMMSMIVRAEEGHDHGEGEKEPHAPEGKNAGITSFDEKNGFKLSDAATKKFNYSSVKIQGKGPWKIPSSSVLRSKDEKNVYRLRNHFIKRIDFKLIKNEGTYQLIDSHELIEGDAVITSNIGFIRIAEITAFGGNEEGHSH